MGNNSGGTSLKNLYSAYGGEPPPWAAYSYLTNTVWVSKVTSSRLPPVPPKLLGDFSRDFGPDFNSAA